MLDFFQILLGVLKLGVFASYFPSSVIKGMMAAIGIILISKQIPLVEAIINLIFGRVVLFKSLL
ncbi:MAG: SulP family inorganic anion transporter [Cloacibacterium normanense]